MRRSLLAAALLIGVVAGFVPRDAVADHCNRVLIHTGTKSPGTNPADGSAIPARLNAGCVNAGVHVNTNRITPGSNTASVRAQQGAKEPLPVSGTLTFGETTVELEFKPNNANPANATAFNSQEIPIDYSKVDKLVAKVVFADGSEQTATYTK